MSKWAISLIPWLVGNDHMGFIFVAARLAMHDFAASMVYSLGVGSWLVCIVLLFLFVTYSS